MAAEKNVENNIRRHFEKLPNAVLYKNFANAYTVAGRPDLSGIYKGVPIAIEVKRGKGGNFKPNQLDHLTKWAQAGGISILTCLPSVNDVLTDQTKFEKQVVTIEDVYQLETEDRIDFAHKVWKKYCPLMMMIDPIYRESFIERLFK